MSHRAALLTAALALPGVAPPASALDMPDGRTVGVRHLEYRDGQPGFSRIRVSSPSAFFVGPVAEDWSLAANVAVDAVSGASPRWHDAVSSASSFRDRRVAGDWRLTRHFEQASLTIGVAHSDERDYRSRALVGGVRWRADADGNTVWNVGAAVSRDRVDGVEPSPIEGRRRGWELLAGMTHVPTPVDVVQVQASVARTEGQLTDPYKYPDRRPGTRDQLALQLRWNHHFATGPAVLAGSTLRATYRAYGDSWGVRAHTVGAEWVRPLAGGWSIAPLARLHTQRAASFYYDPVYDARLGEPFPPGFAAALDAARSPDQRLSGFGAAAVGLRIAVRIDDAWSVDLRGEWYRQQGGWRVGGEGSPGLARLDATMVQIGVSRRF